jgi:hypothetical protein
MKRRLGSFYESIGLPTFSTFIKFDDSRREFLDKEPVPPENEIRKAGEGFWERPTAGNGGGVSEARHLPSGISFF